MRRWNLEVAPCVLDQIAEVVVRIAADSVDNALAWEDRLTAAIKRIADSAGHAIDEEASERLGRRIRRMVFERNYFVHYVVDEDANLVRVINFRHGARQPNRGEP